MADERRCIQHGYDYSAICPLCSAWWWDRASAEERRTLVLLAEPLMAGRDDASEEPA